MPERTWVFRLSLLVMSLTLVPYLLGWALAFGRFYTAYHYNLDDFCVYTAWMEQARRGHFFFDNRFTTDPQPRQTVHLFFWVLGTLVRFTGIPHQAMIHLARFTCGLLFLWSFWRLTLLTLNDTQARQFAMLLVVFSSGFGWLFWQDTGWEPPADGWQPELTTFPSLYLNPLFLVSLWLIVEIWICVLQVEGSAGWKTVIRGAIFTLLLGNIHTYDLVPMAGVGLGFVLLRLFLQTSNFKLQTQSEVRLWGKWLLIGVGALPSVLWLMHVYSIDPVFKSRAATLTFSEPVWKYLLGYGLVLIGAIFGAFFARRGDWVFTRHGRTLLPAWGLIGFLLPYLPVLFQRKLWMGLHLPLCLLTAGALVLLLRGWKRPAWYGLVFIALTVPTNLLWVWRDLRFLGENISNTMQHTPYLSVEDAGVLRYLRDRSDVDAGVLALPGFAAYIAAFSGHPVYAGHWSETPDFKGRYKQVLHFYDARTGDEERVEFLRQARIRYVLLPTDTSQPLLQLPDRTVYWANLDSIGREVYRNRLWRVLEVNL